MKILCDLFFFCCNYFNIDEMNIAPLIELKTNQQQVIFLTVEICSAGLKVFGELFLNV